MKDEEKKELVCSNPTSGVRFKSFYYTEISMYLVGTAHIDPKGPERLTKLLNYLKPKSVSLEWVMRNGSVNPSYDELLKELNFLKSFQERQKKLTMESKLPQFYKEFIIWLGSFYCYEFSVPVNLKKDLEFNLYCVDHPMRLSKIYQEYQIPKSWIHSAKENEQKLKGISLETAKQELQRLIDKAYYDPLILREIDKSTGLTVESVFPGKEDIRESYIANNLKKLNPDVHIGGLLHTKENLSDELTKGMSKVSLAKRLKELGVKITPVKLIKMDQIK